MVNRVIRGINGFIDKINSFANKTKKILSKIGIDLGFGEIGRLAEIKFAKELQKLNQLLAKQVVCHKML